MIKIIEFKWRPISHPLLYQEEARAVEQRFYTELQTWKDTPYAQGQCCKGVACDCVRFIFAIIDFMYGFTRFNGLAALPQDTAFHDPIKARAAFRAILDTYPYSFVDDGSIEPADIIITGSRNGGPGHAMIAGIEQNELWHQTPLSGVQRTGPMFGGNDMMHYHRTIRSKDKYLWLPK